MVRIGKEHHVSADYWNHLPQLSEHLRQAATSTDFLDGAHKGNGFEVKIIAIKDQP